MIQKSPHLESLKYSVIKKITPSFLLRSADLKRAWLCALLSQKLISEATDRKTVNLIITEPMYFVRIMSQI